MQNHLINFFFFLRKKNQDKGCSSSCNGKKNKRAAKKSVSRPAWSRSVMTKNITATQKGVPPSVEKGSVTCWNSWTSFIESWFRVLWAYPTTRGTWGANANHSILIEHELNLCAALEKTSQTCFIEHEQPVLACTGVRRRGILEMRIEFWAKQQHNLVYAQRFGQTQMFQDHFFRLFNGKTAIQNNTDFARDRFVNGAHCDLKCCHFQYLSVGVVQSVDGNVDVSVVLFEWICCSLRSQKMTRPFNWESNKQKTKLTEAAGLFGG